MRASNMIFIVGFLVLFGCEGPAEKGGVHPVMGLSPITIGLFTDDVAPEARAAFADIIDGATIVAIGESRHDTSEQFLVKAELVKLMIADYGYRTLIIEESFSHALAIDAFVTSGEGQIRTILTDLAGWYLWDIEEMVDLITWIRQYNDSVDDGEMVRVLGMDITAPALGNRSVSTIAQEIDPQGAWLSKDYGADLHEGDFWPVSLQRYGSLEQARRSSIQNNLDDLARFANDVIQIQDFEAPLAGQLLAIQAEIGRRGNEMFCASTIAEIGAVREQGMARVIEWIDKEIAGSKGIVIWTHNLHAAKANFRMPEMGDGDFTPMGVLLSNKYGAKYRSIGGAFGTGYYPQETPPGERRFLRLADSTLDGAMGLVANDVFIADLRNLDPSSEAAQWLLEEREWRMQDATAFLSPLAGFDAIYYVDSVTRARLTPNAVRRGSESN